MIEGIAIAALTLAALSLGTLIWVAKRMLDAIDVARKTNDLLHEAQMQNQTYRASMEIRDIEISGLQEQAKRLRAALDVSETSPAPVIDKENAGASIRQSLDAMRAAGAKPATPMPHGKTPTTQTKAVAPSAGVAGSIVGDQRVLQDLPTGTAFPALPSKDRPDRAAMHGSAAKPPVRPK